MNVKETIEGFQMIISLKNWIIDLLDFQDLIL